MPGTRDDADPGSPDVSVAVCGLGLMGLPIAFRLLSAGYRTIVWNRSQDRVRSAAERGAEVAPTPAEAAARADLVLTLLASPEALFEVVTQIISGRAPPKQALAFLHQYWIAGTKAHELRFDDGRVLVNLRKDALDFDLIASLVAYRMVEQVLSLPTERLHICQGPNCSWVFIDSSKAGRRRWCDMAVCGNAAKSRRFYARSRQRRKSRRDE